MDVAATSKDGSTALHCAMLSDSDDRSLIIEALLKSNANALAVDDNDNFPINIFFERVFRKGSHHRLQEKVRPGLRTLLTASVGCENRMNSHGNFPLHSVASESSITPPNLSLILGF